MKIRAGFVSNSSSSSFCLYGTSIYEEDKLKAGFKKLTGRDEFTTDAGEEIDGMWEIAEFMADKMNTDFEIDGECGYYYFGNGYEGAGADQTFGEFRTSTEKVLKDTFGDDIDVGHIEETVYG